MKKKKETYMENKIACLLYLENTPLDRIHKHLAFLVPHMCPWGMDRNHYFLYLIDINLAYKKDTRLLLRVVGKGPVDKTNLKAKKE